MRQKRTSLELVTEQSEEASPPRSLVEGLGMLRLLMVRLEQELAQREEEQDAENLLEQLVGLASVAVSLGDHYVLPAIQEENRV